MLWVDYRRGSNELIAPLRALGLPVEKTMLEFGDLAFEGRGDHGVRVPVGIEFKRLEEFVQATRTERLQGHQLVGMRQMFDYSYLFIEGVLLYDRRGGLLCQRGKRRQRVESLPGQMTVNELLKRLFVLHLCGGLNPWWTVNRQDTLQAILALYRTWTDVDRDRHKSHISIYEAPPLVPISDFRRTVKTFPHIGMRASLAVQQHFGGNLQRAVTAPAEEWADITTQDGLGKARRLGTHVAQQIVDFCRGPNACSR